MKFPYHGKNHTLLLFLKSIYVDDVSYGADDEDAAFKLYMKSEEILAEGGFNLRKFVTNSARLNHCVGCFFI